MISSNKTLATPLTKTVRSCIFSKGKLKPVELTFNRVEMFGFACWMFAGIRQLDQEG